VTGQTKRVKRYNRYPSELKRKIAKEYLSGAASYSVLAEEHGLRDRDVAKEFVKWYRRMCELGGENEAAMPTKKGDEPKGDEQSLKQQVKELQKRLALSELKVEALETMIDLAEEQLHVDIRKKSGAKQSKR
jgi:transposase